MASPTVSAGNSPVRFNEVVASNHPGAALRVASITTTTVVVDDASLLGGASLYSASNPGLLIVKTGVAASDEGLVAQVTGITSNTLTVDVDFTLAGSAPALADGDIVYVAPPQSIKLVPNGSFSVALTSTVDVTKGLYDRSPSIQTPNGLDISGDLGFFVNRESLGTTRLLAMGVGGYVKSGAGQHDFAPYLDDTATYADSSLGAIYAKVGNGVTEAVFPRLYASSLSISFPERGLPSASLSFEGNLYGRELGGTGKVFPVAGATSYVQNDLVCDSGPRFPFNAVFFEVGGTYGDDLTDAREDSVTSATVTISKPSTRIGPLGNDYMSDSVEAEHEITLEITRAYEDDSIYDLYLASGLDGTLAKTESRFLLKAVSQVDATKSLEIDIPNGIVETYSKSQNAQGRNTETFTIRGIYSLGADNCPDEVLYRIRQKNGVDVDVLASIANA